MHWYSDNRLVASVDDNGNVSTLEEGTAIINAVAGVYMATCSIKVVAPSGEIPEAIDDVDEYAVNHGPGVEINGTIWAPVNCGYHAEDFKYGKLYRWG